jgi:hypothetical protein
MAEVGGQEERHAWHKDVPDADDICAGLRPWPVMLPARMAKKTYVFATVSRNHSITDYSRPGGPYLVERGGFTGGKSCHRRLSWLSPWRQAVVRSGRLGHAIVALQAGRKSRSASGLIDVRIWILTFALSHSFVM